MNKKLLILTSIFSLFIGAVNAANPKTYGGPGGTNIYTGALTGNASTDINNLGVVVNELGNAMNNNLTWANDTITAVNNELVKTNTAMQYNNETIFGAGGNWGVDGIQGTTDDVAGVGGYFGIGGVVPTIQENAINSWTEVSGTTLSDTLGAESNGQVVVSQTIQDWEGNTIGTGSTTINGSDLVRIEYTNTPHAGGYDVVANLNTDAIETKFTELYDSMGINQTTGQMATTTFTGTNLGEVTDQDGNVIKNAQTSIADALNTIDGIIGDMSVLDGHGGDTHTDFSSATTIAEALKYLDNNIISKRSDGLIHLGQNSVVINDKTGEISLDGTKAIRTISQLDGKYHDVATVDWVSAGLRGLDGRIDELNEKLGAGFAASNAMSALVPNARSSGDTQISFGTGGYANRVGVAAGLFHYVNNGTLVNAGAAYGTGANAEISWRAGVTFGF
ncbi:MAG: YadA-like family protein [Rickettsiales bacterium]|jgi:hypothetical protein|nr:YadA-like family protein [Rickettsiales bacterium]